jgi:hypothetical protein
MALKMDFRTIKMAYISLGLLFAICAIVSSYLKQYYFALGFIVLASAIILAGSIYVSYVRKLEWSKELEKL